MVAQLVNKFPAFYGSPKFHYRVHKGLQLDPVLSHTNLVHLLFL